MKRLVLLAFSVLSLTAFAQLKVETPQFATTTTTLANGLTLIIHEDHSAPVVAVNLWYHVGSKDDPPGKSGFAHLFEHVMFQGSKHVAEDTFFKLLQGAGGSGINGTTNLDRTNFYETVPKHRLNLALWLESDRMGFLLDHANQATFESQRDVVKSERRQNYENRPLGMVYPLMASAFYPPEHPYHRTTIGNPEDLDRATLADVQAFFREWYGPNNASLVLAGDVDPVQATALVEQYFGPIVPVPAPTRKPVEAVKLSAEKRIVIEAGINAAGVRLWWPTPAVHADGDATLDLLADVISNGPSARLRRRLVEEKRIAQAVWASQNSASLGSVFEIGATALPGHSTEELVKEIDQVMAELGSAPISSDELERARTRQLTRYVFSLEAVGNRADAFNSYQQTLGSPDKVAFDMSRWQRVTLADLVAAVPTWLPKDRRLVTVITPNKAAPAAGRLEVTP